MNFSFSSLDNVFFFFLLIRLMNLNFVCNLKCIQFFKCLLIFINHHKHHLILYYL